jgi:hypothetical protein
MKLNRRETKVIIIFITIWGLIFTGSGLIMNNNKKIITNINYKLDVKTKKSSQTQAKKIEIELKDIEIEINTPISVNIKDYLVDGDNVDENIIKQLELDTSLVNITQAGTYTYTIKYNKKKYQGTVKVKEKELPDMSISLKEISLFVGEAIPTDKKFFINESLPEEVYNNIKLEIPEIDTSLQNDYKYYAVYKNTRYEGTIKIRDKGINEIVKNKCPEETEYDENTNTCTCKDKEKKYDSELKICK